MTIESFTIEELLRYAGVHAATPLEQELAYRLEAMLEEYDSLNTQLTEKDEELETKDDKITDLERELERVRDIVRIYNEEEEE